MSADRLRLAAKVLRERAQAATPGPWEDVAGAWGLPSDGPDHMRVLQSPHRDASTALARLEYDQQGGADAAYIATVHPRVGLALADWLDLIATSWSDPHADNHTDLDGWHIEFEESTDTHGLKIADLILGTTP